jgi:hypothetical protein
LGFEDGSSSGSLIGLGALPIRRQLAWQTRGIWGVLAVLHKSLRCLATLVLALATPAAAEPDIDITYAAPDVGEQNGDIVYYDGLGSEHPLTQGGGFAQPRLSPDGKVAAFIRIEKEGEPSYDEARTSVWLADVRTRKIWRLLASSPSDEPTANLAAMWKPQFALNGKAIYVMAEAWVTSSAIHRIDIASARHRFIIDGELLDIEATGKYRGYLFVRKKRYLPAPDYGTDYPLYYVRPDGKWSVMIPDSAE